MTTTTGIASGSGGGGGSEPVAPPPNSFAGIVLSIYNDLLSNALHEVVSEAHRAEKLLRTQQIQLASAAEAAKPATTQSTTEEKPEPKPPVGNPMTVILKEIVCPKCKLPRHTLETLATMSGTNSKEEKKKYCSKLPWQNRPLHDIYGNPSPTVSVSAKEKKAKAAAAAVAAAEGNANGESTTGDGDTPAISIPNGRKADSVVYFKCTNCNVEKIAAARFAAHLEKCLGLAGRKSSRAAMAKINGSGSGGGSQGGSGAVSPALGPVDVVGGKGSGKGTPDVGDGEIIIGKKEKGVSFMTAAGGDDGGINVPPPPPASGTGGTTGTAKIPGTLKKKKKPVVKDTAATAAAAVIVGGAGEEGKDLAPVSVATEDSQSQAPTSALAREPKDPSATPVKKRKRKAEASANSDVLPTLVKGDSSVTAVDDKDVSITLARSTSKPPVKKQKIEGGQGALEGMGSPVLKKNQLSKFKDRESPSPGSVGKKVDGKRDLLSASGKFPPGRTSTPPPSSTNPIITVKQAPGSPVIPAKHPPALNGSPKASPSKVKKKAATVVADGIMRKVKSSQGVSTAGSIGVLPRAGSTTPKIAKKTLPSTGVNVPPPPGGKIAGKTLPKKSPVVGSAALVKEKKEKDIMASPEKMRKTMSNGSVGGVGGAAKAKMRIPKAGAGAGTGGKVGGVAGKTVPGATVPGKRAMGMGSTGAGGGGGGGGGGSNAGGDGDGGVPRKRPKVGGE